MRPYKTWAASSSPLTNLSRTAAQLASLLGIILMPYFSSNFITEAITTDAQSVSGIKPILTSFFSGASEPAAQAALRVPNGTIDISAAPPVMSADFLSKSRRSALTTAAPSRGLDLSDMVISWLIGSCDLQKIRPIKNGDPNPAKKNPRGLGRRCPVKVIASAVPSHAESG